VAKVRPLTAELLAIAAPKARNAKRRHDLRVAPVSRANRSFVDGESIAGLKTLQTFVA
jgi:hypothetical protein